MLRVLANYCDVQCADPVSNANLGVSRTLVGNLAFGVHNLDWGIRWRVRFIAEGFNYVNGG